MSIEAAMFIKIPLDFTKEVRDLYRQSVRAHRRVAKQDAGARSEAVRFEALNSAIEKLGIEALSMGAEYLTLNWRDGTAVPPDRPPSDPDQTVIFGDVSLPAFVPESMRDWLGSEEVAVLVNFPHHAGETPIPGEPGVGPPPPLDTWRSSSSDPRVSSRERFEYQIALALRGGENEPSEINPSGAANRVLTEGLRLNVCVEGDEKPIYVPVRYRDGSAAAVFPFRVLKLSDRVPDTAREFHFTLLSVRHVEMDEVVDGAWFRNTRISQRRQAGQTDAIAYDISLRQLDLLLQDGPAVIYMYQTGLEPALMGFYRAVCQSMIDRPQFLTIVPRYFHGDRFDDGTPWSTL